MMRYEKRIELYKGGEETIVAIATPQGRGAIGVVKMSGPRSLEIAERVFYTASGMPVTKLKNRTIHLGAVQGEGGVIDEALAFVMRGPRSYTGEDCVEISCHGSSFVLKRVVEECMKGGARAAQPGEFTRRAVMNGRIDLTQAEAVAELIEAESEQAARCALRQLKGGLGQRVSTLRKGVIRCAALLEAALEFPDEELDLPHREKVKDIIGVLIDECQQLLRSHREGRMIREGAKIAIVGKVNAGKSTLFNKLLERERAIVTEEEGTTRDTLTETISLGGYSVRLTDTAGMGAGEGEAAREAVRRSRIALEEADLVLYVADMSRCWSQKDRGIARSARGKRGIVVFNKKDIEQRIDEENVPVHVANWRRLKISALRGSGIRALRRMIIKEAGLESGPDGASEIICSLRHAETLAESIEAMRRALEAAKCGYTEEVISMELGTAAERLGEITGEVLKGEILDEIFSRFCIGK